MIATRANYEDRMSELRAGRQEPYSIFLANPGAAEVLRAFSAIAEMLNVATIRAERNANGVTLSWTFSVIHGNCDVCGGSLRNGSSSTCYHCRERIKRESKQATQKPCATCGSTEPRDLRKAYCSRTCQYSAQNARRQEYFRRRHEERKRLAA